MGIFTLDPWGRFLSIEPLKVALWTFLFVAGVMLIMRAIDIAFIRGMKNDIDGYLSWWVIVSFDLVGAPWFAFLAAKFARATSDYGLHPATTTSWPTWVALAIATFLASVFIFTAKNGDWTKVPGPNLSSLNIAGWYHLVMFIVLAHFIGTVILRGAVLIWIEGKSASPEIIILFFGMIALLIISFIWVTLGPDMKVRSGNLPRPSDLLGTNF